jgi:hypothetical protein
VPREHAATNGHAATSRRRAAVLTATLPPPSPAVRVIPADAIFRLDELRAILGLPMTCLRREARLGRLRVSRRSGRYWTTGAWLREWLDGGEVKPRPGRGATLASGTES